MALGRHLYKKDIDFDSAAYSALSQFCNSTVELYHPDSVSRDWNPDTGLEVVYGVPSWRGYAAITPNKDWRARSRISGYEHTATHAYRIQLWHIDENLLHPEDKWGTVPRPDVQEGWIVKVSQHNSDKVSEGARLIVRNRVTDSDMWQVTILADIDTGDQRGEHS